MAKILFASSVEFLSERLLDTSATKRMALGLKASLNGVASVVGRMDDLLNSSWDKFDETIKRHWPGLDADAAGAEMQLHYGAHQLSGREQMNLLRSVGGYTEIYLLLARQKQIPAEVQTHLMTSCWDNTPVMHALASNSSIEAPLMEALARHDDDGVRVVLAHSLGGRMRVEENSHATELKNRVFSILAGETFTEKMAPALVPVCRNPVLIEHMYQNVALNTSSARLFVENPFTPNQVLVDVLNSATLRFQWGGSDVTQQAATILENRIQKLETIVTKFEKITDFEPEQDASSRDVLSFEP